MAGKMTQSQIMKELATATGSSTKAAKTFVTSFADMAIRETKKNGMFVIPGIGRLVRVDRKARMGRNPATGGDQDPGQESSKVPRRQSGQGRDCSTEEKINSLKNSRPPRRPHGGLPFQKSIKVRSNCEQIQEALRLLLFVDVVFLGFQSILEILNAFA
jgi:DNA-binding protein HU-beta